MVIGSLNFDHVVTVERLPGEGETLSGTGYLSVPGGKGFNQAVTAARQGARVAMVGCVGDDPPGQALLEILRNEGTDTSGARIVVGVPTGVALITVARSGANTIVVAPGANGELDLGSVQLAGRHFGPGTVVLCQLEVPLVPVKAALSLARARGATTVLNPSPAPAEVPRELLGVVDVLVPNETEATAITGCGDPQKAVAWLRDRGCRSVALTLGERGALVAEAGQASVVVPTYDVAVKDTTAAGDAFCGALAAALASGSGLAEAVRRGCAAGALATTVMGALPSLPTAAQVDGLLEL